VLDGAGLSVKHMVTVHYGLSAAVLPSAPWQAGHIR